MPKPVSKPEVVGGDRTWFQFFGGFILCCIFCYGCTFPMFVLVFQYLAKRLAGKNVSKMTHFFVGWDVKPELTQSFQFYSASCLFWVLHPTLLFCFQTNRPGRRVHLTVDCCDAERDTQRCSRVDVGSTSLGTGTAEKVLIIIRVYCDPFVIHTCR